MPVGLHVKVNRHNQIKDLVMVANTRQVESLKQIKGRGRVSYVNGISRKSVIIWFPQGVVSSDAAYLVRLYYHSWIHFLALDLQEAEHWILGGGGISQDEICHSQQTGEKLLCAPSLLKQSYNNLHLTTISNFFSTTHYLYVFMSYRIS